MANYFIIDYENTANTSPSNVELNYGSPYSDGLTVHVAFYPGAGFTPTHYKMWGLELVQGEGVVTVSGAEWLTYTDSRTAWLDNNGNQQYAYVKFKDVSETETETFQSNPVTFSFVEPTIGNSVVWKQDFSELGFNSTTSNTLINTTANIEVTFNKSTIDQLSFSDRDFSGLRVSTEAIYIDPDSQIGKLINADSSSYASLSKLFSSSEVPLITVDLGDGLGPVTLSTYDFQEKSTLSGTLVNRIGNINWNSETRLLTFDVFRFSTYGFCVVDKIEFTPDSQTGAYIGGTASFRVYVQDTNGEPVENAPVVVSGISGNIGSIQESMPVLTGSDGVAEFNFNVTSSGLEVLEAHVNSNYTESNLVMLGVVPADHQRSLLTQYEQIFSSVTYDDSIVDVNTVAVAEPTSSGVSVSVIEHDLNVFRTLLKQIKGTTNWYDTLPVYFDPTNTDVISTENKELNMSNLKNVSLDSQTIILAISESNSDAGFSLTPGDEGFIFNTSLGYATPNDRRGLPIFKSTTNSGTYHDEGGDDRVVGIDLLDVSTGGQFKDISNNIVFAKFHDGVDHGGSGDGTDVYVKFYTDAGEYTTVSGDPSAVMFIYPYRKTLAELAEHEWLRTDFVSSWEGDSAVVNSISDLWGYTGAANDDSSPSWVTISGTPMVDSSVSSLKAALDTINTQFGSRLFTEQNYITNGQSFSDSLDSLDTNMFVVSQLVTAGSESKYIVSLDVDVDSGTLYELPAGASYTPNSAAGQEGKNMDIYLNGQLLSASTGVNGANYDLDYSEIDSTHIVFNFDVLQYSNITFVIRN